MDEEMTLESLAARSAGDASAPHYIAGVLREAIYRGLLPEGKPLHQAQLALRLGVSPIPLREALRLLETEGLIAFRGHRGAVVTALSVDEARELYEMISALETSLMRIAFPRITKRVVEDAAKALDMMEREEDCIRWRDLNQMFHNLFFEPADRPLTLDMLARLRQKTDRNIRIHLASMKEESQRQHRAILDAVAARDLDAALEALAAHLAYTSNDLQSCMRRR
ncbi:MAG: GntR family transcriptional regulator [Synergistaceae bacterium]|nr:GntR family transcriptional regulator [Synergistota bacterium]NLM72228.1 GntR family transcriptional regulator [Synergistaceae bacterium]